MHSKQNIQMESGNDLVKNADVMISALLEKIKESMDSLAYWVKQHPFKAVAFSSYFSFLVPVMALQNEGWEKVCSVLFALGVGIFAFTVVADFHRIVIGILILTCVTPLRGQSVWALPPIPTDPDPDIYYDVTLPPPLPHEPAEGGGAPAAGCAVAVGVVVIVAAGYVGYRIIKFCQRNYGKPKEPEPIGPPVPTNSPPAGALAGVGKGFEGGAWGFSPIGSCYSPDDTDCRSEEGGDGGSSPANGNTFVIDGTLTESEGATHITTSISFFSGEEETWTFRQFQDWLRVQGVTFSGNGGDEKSYSINGQPVSEAESSIHFDSLGGHVSVYRDWSKVRRVDVSRSHDLKVWTHLLSFQQEVGTAFRVQDTTGMRRMFYRLEIGQLD